MLDKEQEPKKGKKKKGLSAKMGLDVGSTSFAPPAAKPGLFPGSAEGELNARSQEESIGTKLQDKLSRRPNGR